VKYTNYERYSARLNANFKLFNDKVRFELILNYTTDEIEVQRMDVERTTPGLAISLALLIPVYKSTGEYGGPIGSGIQIEIIHY
jgi:hypothetical protein